MKRLALLAVVLLGLVAAADVLLRFGEPGASALAQARREARR